VVLDCYFSYKWPPNQAQRANNSIRTYRYLRKHFPEIPYRRLNLHTFPCFYTLDLYITYTAYTIIHHGQQITPTWNLTWLPMEWKWWKRTPITQRKYDRTNVNTVSVEDILVAHVGSLARDSKQKDTVSYAELLGWLKWPTGRVKRRGDDTEETAKRSRPQMTEHSSATEIYSKLGPSDMETEIEQVVEKQEWCEREIVYPGEVL
jgi:hypothetical protein